MASPREGQALLARLAAHHSDNLQALHCHHGSQLPQFVKAAVKGIQPPLARHSSEVGVLTQQLRTLSDAVADLQLEILALRDAFASAPATAASAPPADELVTVAGAVDLTWPTAIFLSQMG